MLTRRAARRRGSQEAGFTLIELVVTIAILGIVVSSLIGVVFSYLQLSNETATRLSESTDQQFVSAYWQQDVSSLGLHAYPSGGTVPNAPSVYVGSAPGCTPSTGTPLVMFTWSDYGGVPTDDPTLTWLNSTQNYATYYAKTVTNANGTTQVQVWRKRCGGTSSDMVVARHLTGAPAVACYDSSGTLLASCAGTDPFPATVTVTLSVQDKSQAVRASTGYTNLTLTAQRRQG